MSWESTDTYYQLINRIVRDKLGELNSGQILMYSLNFADIEPHQRIGNWQVAANRIMKAAVELERAGADFIVICSVTGHEGADSIQDNIGIPLLHIADCIKSKLIGLKTIGLLGTLYTMELGYFKSKLKPKVIVPELWERQFVSNTIYNEISQGAILDRSRRKYIEIISNLAKKGAEGVILGCTEIPLLIKQADVNIPVFDSVKIHCEEAVNLMLGV
jgi:aspartate racemase